MPVKRRRYVKFMDKLWRKCDKSMTPLMTLMYGGLLRVFIHGRLRMDNIYGYLHVVDYTWFSCRHVNDVRKLCERTHGCHMSGIYMILYKW